MEPACVVERFSPVSAPSHDETVSEFRCLPVLVASTVLVTLAKFLKCMAGALFE